jgi:hypothetical protein
MKKSPNQKIREIRFYWDKFIAYMSIHVLLHVMCLVVGLVSLDISVTKEVGAVILISWAFPNASLSVWLWYNKE